MMATAEFSLIRAYLDWQSEMGSDEVVLPQPLAKRPPAFSASADASKAASNPVALSDSARPISAAGRKSAPPDQTQNSQLQPEFPSAVPGVGSNAAADLYASLTQALNKSPDPRTGDSVNGGPVRAALRGPEAFGLPVFSDLAAFWGHLERSPGLVSGELSTGVMDAPVSTTGSRGANSAMNAGLRLIRGSGPLQAPLALIGFEPGEADVAEGRPFQGEPGVLLEKMMRAIRLDIRELYLTHLIKIHIPGKAWTRRELIRMIPLLHAELGLAQVPMVLLFGQECAQAVLKTGKTLDELRQETHRMEGREFFVTYHPAELLRKEELKRKAWEDLQWLQRRLTQENGLARP